MTWRRDIPVTLHRIEILKFGPRRKCIYFRKPFRGTTNRRWRRPDDDDDDTTTALTPMPTTTTTTSTTSENQPRTTTSDHYRPRRRRCRRSLSRYFPNRRPNKRKIMYGAFLRCRVVTTQRYYSISLSAPSTILISLLAALSMFSNCDYKCL